MVIKEYIKKIQKKYKIELILDLHGHSRKYIDDYSGWEVFSTEIISEVTSCYSPTSHQRQTRTSCSKRADFHMRAITMRKDQLHV